MIYTGHARVVAWLDLALLAVFLLVACLVLLSMVAYRAGQIVGHLSDENLARRVAAELRKAGEADHLSPPRLDA